MKYYVFPKNFLGFSLDEMMESVARCGFDGPTALIRNGYWISQDNATKDLSEFVKKAQANGLEVKYGSADISLDSLEQDGAGFNLLKSFAQNGITQVRLQHIGKKETDNVREYAEQFRRRAYWAEQAGEKAGLQCVIQLHGMCYPHNATAVYKGIEGLNPKYIGVKMDPGNNLCQEGYELFWYQIQLLGEYLCAMGAKDVGWFQDGDVSSPSKGWRLEWLPAYKGLINYQDIYKNLKKAEFKGPVITMPFYSAETNEKWLDEVAKELSYLKQCEKEA